MKKLRHAFSLLIAVALVVGILSPQAFAIQKEQIEVSSEEVAYSVTTAQTFTEAYELTDDSNVVMGYHYEMIDNDGTYDTTLEVSVCVDGTNYIIVAAGCLTRYELETGKVLFEGPLEANVTIDGTLYHVLIGMQKLEGSEEICATVNMMPDSSYNFDEQILFVIGTPVLNDADIQSISGSHEKFIADTDIPSRQTNVSARAYSYVGAVDGSLPNYGKVLTLREYYDTTNVRVMLSVQSYTSAINNRMLQLYDGANSYVSSIELGLTRIGSTGQISGLDTITSVPGSDLTGITTTLIGLVEDLLIAAPFSVPSSTLTNILGSLKTTRTYEVTGSNSWVKYSFGLATEADLDDLEEGIPVSFQLDRAAAAPAGTFRGTGYVELLYKSRVYMNGGWAYVYTGPARQTISVSMNV